MHMGMAMPAPVGARGEERAGRVSVHRDRSLRVGIPTINMVGLQALGSGVARRRVPGGERTLLATVEAQHQLT